MAYLDLEEKGVSRYAVNVMKPGESILMANGKTFILELLTTGDTQFNAPGCYNRKYINLGYAPNTAQMMNSSLNIYILRFADLLLMHAEALNELGQTGESKKYINVVRKRAFKDDQ